MIDLASSARRIEQQKLKEELSQNHILREKLKFLSKRDRVLKNGWKNGVMGVPSPEKGKIVRFEF